MLRITELRLPLDHVWVRGRLTLARAWLGPSYGSDHLPLVMDHQGERLAKRHQSLTLAELRAATDGNGRPFRVITLPAPALAPATPMIRLVFETRPSFTPNTAARRLPPP